LPFESGVINVTLKSFGLHSLVGEREMNLLAFYAGAIIGAIAGMIIMAILSSGRSESQDKPRPTTKPS
jgi:hypothetical protein